MKPISVDISNERSALRSGDRLGELLGALAMLAPPERIIHVGTGAKHFDPLCWLDWPLTEAVVIDAEEQSFDFVERGLGSNTKLCKHAAVVADAVGQVDYFVANNLSENSLVDPALLKMVWPSLAQSHRLKKEALTIDRLVSETKLRSWLIIDCLPAVRILSGATSTLQDATLVCVRALAEAGFRGDPAGADIKGIDSWLAERGFRRLAFISGLNPKIGHAIYGRPAEQPDVLQADAAELEQVRMRSEQLQATLIERDLIVQARESQLDATAGQIAKLNENFVNLVAQRDTLASQLQTAEQSVRACEERSGQLAQQMQSRMTELEQERSRSEQLHLTVVERDVALQAQAVDLEVKAGQITKLNEDLGNTATHRDSLAVQLQTATHNLQASEDRSTQLAQHLQTSTGELEQQRLRNEQLRATLAERDAALHALTEEKQMSAALMAKLNEQILTLTSERDSLAQSIDLKQQNLQSCEQSVLLLRSELEAEITSRERLIAENQELIHRQKLMNEELVKAEGQIGLIKDLLLREQGL